MLFKHLWQVWQALFISTAGAWEGEGREPLHQGHQTGAWGSLGMASSSLPCSGLVLSVVPCVLHCQLPSLLTIPISIKDISHQSK